ncbi:hypothetical protein [Saccharopolyspora sp. NPDC002686]|uniref:SMP-30/gluconolactonase/LRE family protein n=1 Tax=Saccharopolyspora sp. NPDC002686 TaxID=3154541 RepID=UPI00332389B1
MRAEHDRYRGSGRLPRSERWRIERLTEANPLWGSNGIAFGPDGRLYVAQYVAGRISAVDLGSGDVEVVVDLDGPIQSPDDLAFGTDGSMYITDLTPGRVWRRTPDGAFTLVSDEVAATNGIACVGDRVFVNEMRVGGRVLEVTPGAEPVVLAEGLAMGNAMQLGPDGCLYYPHMITGEVHRVSPDGGEPELVAEDVHAPVAVRFDRGGSLTCLAARKASSPGSTCSAPATARSCRARCPEWTTPPSTPRTACSCPASRRAGSRSSPRTDERARWCRPGSSDRSGWRRTAPAPCSPGTTTGWPTSTTAR